MYQMSSAMASQFVAAAQEMNEIITRLGPNPLKDPGRPGDQEQQ